MGAVDYIYKPINPELLKVKVEVFVELFRKNQQLIEHEKELMAINNALQNEIEERKASEEKIKLLNKQLLLNNEYLRTANEELDRFAYVASHDLQEPLRKIMIFSDKILTEQTNENVNKYLQKIVSSSQRMQSLIQDLLHFARQDISASDFTRYDLNIIVKEALHELEMEIEKTKASVYVEKLPVLYIIPSLIRQLFYNLLNNAIKFRRKDLPPAINIKLSSRKINSITYSLINVEDNGIGFDPKYKEDIFTVFKRLHSYHDFEGSGVGLSICKKIIEKHNGFINAESTPGKGSNFIVGLPNSNLQ